MAIADEGMKAVPYGSYGVPGSNKPVTWVDTPLSDPNAKTHSTVALDLEDDELDSEFPDELQ